MVALARILWECSYMMLRISRRLILTLKVTKWRTGKDFHDLKQVFVRFFYRNTAFWGHLTTGWVKVNSTRQNEKSK